MTRNSIHWVPVSVEVHFAIAGVPKNEWPRETYRLRDVSDLRCWRANERLAMTLSVTTKAARGYWSSAVAAYAHRLNNNAAQTARNMPSLIKGPKE